MELKNGWKLHFHSGNWKETRQDDRASAGNTLTFGDSWIFAGDNDSRIQYTSGY